MKEAKNGDTVKVHYTGKFEDGSVFDSSENRDPLEFTIGSGQVIKGFEEAVEGMKQGEKTTASIPSKNAYGPRRDDMVIEVDKNQLHPDVEPEKGMQLQMQMPNGQPIVATIIDINEKTLKLDANHPLAGKDLNFDIELIEIL